MDAVTGENVSYTYDALNRLTNASASGMWNEAYSYDGFGNLTQKSGTGGTPNVAPSMTASFDANNHQVGVTYDLNGNPTGDSTTNNTWDVENRLVAQTSKTAPYGGVWYAYDPSGKRIRKDANDNSNGLYSQTTELYFYGITGQKLATYRCSYPDGIDMVCAYYAGNVYFGSKLVVSDGVGVVTDRLGSVRWNQNGEQFSYYPYGEERTNNNDGRVKFGTYFRDSAGQDYADQRYYGATTGRFWSPDSAASANPGDPSSWNKYTYVRGDSVNRSDPSGLCDVLLAGITMNPGQNSAFDALGANMITAFPYSGTNPASGSLSVAGQIGGANPATQLAYQAIIAAAAQGTGPINIFTFSGGAEAFEAALPLLPADVASRLNNITYISAGSGGANLPGTVSGLAANGGTTTVLTGTKGFWNTIFNNTIGGNLPYGAKWSRTNACGHDPNCMVDHYKKLLQSLQGSPCSNPQTLTLANLSATSGGGGGGGAGGGGDGYYFDLEGYLDYLWLNSAGSDVSPKEQVTSTIAYILP